MVYMVLDQRKVEEVVVVRLRGRLTAMTAPVLQDVLEAHIAAGEERLLLDCSTLDYISSAGLQVFLLCGRLLAAKQGKLAFAALNEQNTKLFRMTRFETLYPTFSTTGEAMLSLAT